MALLSMRPGLLLACVLAIAAAAVGQDAHGTVIELTGSTFDTNVAEGSWIIKFYAPWCGHCKALQPKFEKAAAAAPATVFFGSVDCTAESKLCERFGVRGYPTVKAFVLGPDGSTSASAPRELRTARSKAGLLAVARRLAAPPIRTVQTEKDLELLLQKEGPVFVLGSDADHVITGAFRAVAAHWFHDQVFAAGTPGSSVRRVERGPDGALDVLEYAGLYDFGALQEWVRATRFPALPAITRFNFGELAHSGRLLALVIVDPGSDKSHRFEAGMRDMAMLGSSSLAPHIRDSFQFATLDGVRWDRHVAQYNIESAEDLPRLVVLDAPRKVFYEDPSVRELTDVETFLAEVAAGEFPAQREGLLKYPQQLLNLINQSEHKYAIVGGIAVLGVALLVLFVRWMLSDDVEVDAAAAPDASYGFGDDEGAEATGDVVPDAPEDDGLHDAHGDVRNRAAAAARAEHLEDVE